MVVQVGMGCTSLLLVMCITLRTQWLQCNLLPSWDGGPPISTVLLQFWVTQMFPCLIHHQYLIKKYVSVCQCWKYEIHGTLIIIQHIWNTLITDLPLPQTSNKDANHTLWCYLHLCCCAQNPTCAVHVVHQWQLAHHCRGICCLLPPSI